MQQASSLRLLDVGWWIGPVWTYERTTSPVLVMGATISAISLDDLGRVSKTAAFGERHGGAGRSPVTDVVVEPEKGPGGNGATARIDGLSGKCTPFGTYRTWNLHAPQKFQLEIGPRDVLRWQYAST